MRLINKDELLEEAKKKSYSRSSLKFIEDQEEVVAISIEWIEKWIDKITGTREGEDIDISQLSEQLQFAIEMINSMVMDWDIENGHFRWGEKNETDTN